MLVMMLLLCGVMMVYIDGSLVNIGFIDNVDLFGWFGIGCLLGVFMLVWIMVIVFIVVWYMLYYICLGCYIYVLGGNEVVMCLFGISVSKVKIIVYLFCGLIVLLVGIIEVVCFFFV